MSLRRYRVLGAGFAVQASPDGRWCLADDADAEIARLRALVESAYREGFRDAESCVVQADEWDPGECWEASDARAALSPEAEEQEK